MFNTFSIKVYLVAGRVQTRRRPLGTLWRRQVRVWVDSTVTTARRRWWQQFQMHLANMKLLLRFTQFDVPHGTVHHVDDGHGWIVVG